MNRRRSLLENLWEWTAGIRGALSIASPRLAKIYRGWASALLAYPNEQTIWLSGVKYGTRSQALQDIFARVVSSHSGLMTYLEIGSGPPESGNNTFLLEHLGWSGVSVELDGEMVSEFRNVRSNPVVHENALDIDYTVLFKNLEPDRTGYLQIDIDPAPQSLACLLKLPFQTHRFNAITFEHDSYAQGPDVRNRQRVFLRAQGYVLVRGDVSWKPGCPFEDWWVDSTQFNVQEIRDIGRKVAGVWVPRIGPFGMGNELRELSN